MHQYYSEPAMTLYFQKRGRNLKLYKFTISHYLNQDNKEDVNDFKCKMSCNKEVDVLAF